MATRRGVALGVVLAVACAGLILFLSRLGAPSGGGLGLDVASSEKASPTGRAAKTDKPAGLHFRDIRFVGRSKGERQWEVWATSVEALEGQEVVTMNYVRKGTVFKDGQPYLSLTADRGRYSPQRDSFTIDGHVTLESDEGETLKTDTLQWNPQTRQAIGAGPIEAKVKGMSFTANRFAVDITGEWLLASGDVRVVKDNGDRLFSDDLIYSLSDGTWQLRGQVDLTIQL